MDEQKRTPNGAVDEVMALVDKYGNAVEDHAREAIDAMRSFNATN